jgi:ribonucleotide monophosphatase NagD (HAD superfamily)
MLTRRGFLSSMLALGVAPAIVRADSLMRWRVTAAGIVAPAGIALYVGGTRRAPCAVVVGLSWETAFQSLPQAMAAVAAGDRVYVANLDIVVPVGECLVLPDQSHFESCKFIVQK